MMKKIVIFIILLVFLSALTYAESSGVEQYGNDAIEGIEQEFNFELDDFLSFDAVDYVNLLSESFSERIDDPLKIFFTLILVLLVSTVVRGLSLDNNSVSSVMDTVINIVFFLLLLAPVLSVQGSLSSAIEVCKNFLNSFLLVFISLLATSGQPGTAAVASGFFSASVLIVSELIIGVLLPIASIYLSIRVCSLCVNTIEFGGIAEIIRRIARYLLLGIATFFSAVMGMQSLISAAADGVAVRTGKFIVGNGVPIIGPVVQDAITMVIGGISAVKTTAGVAAVIAISVIFIPVFIDCIIYIFMFELTSVMAEISGSVKINKLMKAAVHTIEIYFSCVVLFYLMIIISMLTFVLSGGVV